MIVMRARSMAREAYKRVAEHKAESDGGKAYRSLAEALPGLILQNGLAQATGFLVAKGKDEKDEHEALLKDLNAVLQAAKIVDCEDGKQLHKEIIASDTRQWMQLTRHSLEASAWLKRYAQGLLKGGEESADEAAEENS